MSIYSNLAVAQVEFYYILHDLLEIATVQSD